MRSISRIRSDVTSVRKSETTTVTSNLRAASSTDGACGSAWPRVNELGSGGFSYRVKSMFSGN